MDRPLDLHGMTVAEMLPELDDFLHRAYRKGETRVLVVHGKGTGVLKLEVGRVLTTHPLVVRFRPADSRDGGTGATEVLLVQ